MTPRQRDLLAFVVSYQRSHGGVSPSLDEMASTLGWVSKSNAIRLLASLEEQGHIRRIKHRSRAIEVLRGQAGGIAAAPLTFIPAGTRDAGNAQTTAATGRYPFLSHPTCAQWGRSVHGKAA